MQAYSVFIRAFLPVLAGVFSSSAVGQGLIWEPVEPEVFADPDYSGAYGGLNGIDGYFYMWTTQSGTPSYRIYRSLDGTSWELIGPGSRGTEGIKLSDERILLYGDTDTIVIGQGETWDVRDVSPSEGGSITSAVEANGRIVMVGNSTVVRSVAPARWVSSDGGATFSFEYFGEPNGSRRDLEMAITFAEGRFVAVGVPGLVWTSTDGDGWESHPLPSLSVNNIPQDIQLSSIVHIDGTFFAGGNFATLYKSADGISWELLSQGDSPGIYNTLDEFLVDGDNVYVTGAAGDTFWSDDRGVSWNYYFRSGNLSDLTGGNGRYYAGGHIVPGGGPISPERDLNIGFWESFSAREIGYTQGKWLVLQSLSSRFYFGSPESGNTGFLDSAVTTDNIYYQHPWFGWYTLRSGDWAYHFNMGWIYSASASNANVWIYTGGLDWIFTSESVWPYFYHLSSGHWALYAGGPNWFWNESLQAWMERDEFYDEPWPVNLDFLYWSGISITDSLGPHVILPALAEPAFRQITLQGIPYPGTQTGELGTIAGLFSEIVSDTSRGAGLVPGRQFSFILNPQRTETPPEPNLLSIVLTFETPTSGITSISYDFGPGFKADNIEGTFELESIPPP